MRTSSGARTSSSRARNLSVHEEGGPRYSNAGARLAAAAGTVTLLARDVPGRVERLLDRLPQGQGAAGGLRSDARLSAPRALPPRSAGPRPAARRELKERFLGWIGVRGLDVALVGRAIRVDAEGGGAPFRGAGSRPLGTARSCAWRAPAARCARVRPGAVRVGGSKRTARFDHEQRTDEGTRRAGRNRRAEEHVAVGHGRLHEHMLDSRAFVAGDMPPPPYRPTGTGNLPLRPHPRDRPSAAPRGPRRPDPSAQLPRRAGAASPSVSSRLTGTIVLQPLGTPFSPSMKAWNSAGLLPALHSQGRTWGPPWRTAQRSG